MTSLFTKLPVEIFVKILSYTPRAIDAGQCLAKAYPELQTIIPFVKLLEYDPVSQPEIFEALFYFDQRLGYPLADVKQEWSKVPFRVRLVVGPFLQGLKTRHDVLNRLKKYKFSFKKIDFEGKDTRYLKDGRTLLGFQQSIYADSRPNYDCKIIINYKTSNNEYLDYKIDNSQELLRKEEERRRILMMLKDPRKLSYY